MNLLTHYSAKLDKSQNDKWLNAIMYLQPSYDYKVMCKGSSEGCRRSCLVNSGRMLMPTAIKARTTRTDMFINNNELFNAELTVEINELILEANKQGKRVAIRLNGTSDLDFSGIYKKFPQVQFYEYTKRIDLVKKNKDISNVYYTFSKHENHSWKNVKNLIDNGINVTVVFDRNKHELPSSVQGMKVIDGDKHDRRFEDLKGSIVGLSLKGTNKVKQVARTTGFAI